jgi:glycosyltransferase involved in cell wall biosynthesis
VTSKKKLLFIYGPLGGGGAERVLLDLLCNLDYGKYDVDLCLIINKGVLLPQVPKRVNIIPLWESYSLSYKMAFRMSIWFKNNYLFRSRLKKKLTTPYDVEISFLEGMPLKLHALLDTAAKKLTWVHCDLYNFPYEAHQFAEGEELKAYNKMDTIVAVSNDTLHAFVKRFLACQQQKKVIYNPIDINKILKLSEEYIPKKESLFTIVSLARLTPQKRIDRVIRLAHRLKAENFQVKFKIIGDGELKHDLIREIKRLDVHELINMVGFVDNPFPILKKADILLLSSASEGFGLVLCEAMCLGVPVISTKTAGPAEIIDHNKYGLLCEHDDESIYQAVIQMIKDKSLRTHYAAMGRKRAREFSVKNTITKFEEVLKA